MAVLNRQCGYLAARTLETEESRNQSVALNLYITKAGTSIMDNSARQGEKSELAVASELMMKGYGVSFPFGHDHQYDLIVDKDGDLYTIQVKTANHEDRNRYYIPADADKYEKKYVDLFAGYSEDEVATFFIPVSETSGKRQRVTFTDLEEMVSDEMRQKANHISKYRFCEAVKRV